MRAKTGQPGLRLAAAAKPSTPTARTRSVTGLSPAGSDARSSHARSA